MKNWVIILFVLFMSVVCGACDNKKSSQTAQDSTAAVEIQPDKIYFFYQTSCPHCHYAADYIRKTYPNLAMEAYDIAQDGKGYQLFVKCAGKFKLGQQIGTPLFCMGSHYLMGWSPEYEHQFDVYVKPFL